MPCGMLNKGVNKEEEEEEKRKNSGNIAHSQGYRVYFLYSSKINIIKCVNNVFMGCQPGRYYFRPSFSATFI